MTRVLRTLAVAAAAASTALVPSVAHADYGQANTWSGGALGAARGAGPRTVYPRAGALVSLVTGPPKARLYVQFFDPRCGIGASISAATATVVPGGQGFYETLAVRARKTQRYRSRYGRTTLTASVALAPSSPGVLAGTLRVTGTTRDARRPYRCRIALPIVVRSHQSLLAPLAPGSTDPAVPRTGLVDTRLRPKVPGAIAITKRTDGRFHAAWSLHYTCRSGGRSTVFEGYETARRFPVASDGSFTATETGSSRGVDRGVRYTFRYRSRITGRIGSDGVARGRVDNVQSTRYAGGRRPSESCRTGGRDFAAAP